MSGVKWRKGETLRRGGTKRQKRKKDSTEMYKQRRNGGEGRGDVTRRNKEEEE